MEPIRQQVLGALPLPRGCRGCFAFALSGPPVARRSFTLACVCLLAAAMPACAAQTRGFR